MDYQLFLQELTNVRKSKGITLRQMGRALGVTGQYVSYMERGKTPLKMKDYFVMCEVLKISPGKLLYGKNEKQSCLEFSERLLNLSERDLYIVKNLIAVLELSQER